MKNGPLGARGTIDSEILTVLEWSKKTLNFDVVLNGPKNRKMSAKTEGAKIHHEGGPGIGLCGIMAPGRPRARQENRH